MAIGSVFRTCLAASLVLMAAPVCAQTAKAPEAAPAAAATPAPAAPATVTAPGIPNGMCPLDTNQNADRAALAEMHLATQGSSKILGLYAECAQLNALRVGSSKVTFLSQYMTLVEQQDAKVALNRASTMLVLSSTVGLTSAYSSQATQAMRSNGLGGGTPSFHGILKQSPDFLIVGAEQRHVVKGKEFGVASVSLITVIRGEIVTANFFAPAGGDAAFAALADQAETYGNQLLAANP